MRLSSEIHSIFIVKSVFSIFNLHLKYDPNHFQWITRKEYLQNLTDIYCDKVKEERLVAY